MRLLYLLEDDKELFNSQVNRTLYMIYRDYVENFTLMFEEQGPGYWLKFCITLRSVMQMQGYSIHLAAIDSNHFEDYFISLTKLLTGDNVEFVHTYVKDVVGVSRFHQLLYNIPNSFASRESQLSPSFKRLFGVPSEEKNIVKMVGTLPLHLRAVGSLLRLLERWSQKQPKIDKPWWRPPLSWHYGHQLKASHYEIFLKTHFGDKLLTLLSVKASDICWWTALPQGERANTIGARNSGLGVFISKTCKELNLPLVDRISILEDQLLYSKFFNTAPRGKFNFFWSHPSSLIFLLDTFRELYIVDIVPAFHPFSQVIMSFTNAAFTQDFIFSGTGIESQLHKLRNREKASCKSPPETLAQRQAVNYLLKIMGTHTVKANMAIHMNANFYYSLFRHTEWIDAVNLMRYMWNLPLFLNFLEILLTKIYEFERHFIPMCHFPVHKKMVSAVETLYRKMAEAKYITKSCIIIVEVIIRREHRDPGRCYEARKLMWSIIRVLASQMVFLEEDAYVALDGLLKVGWNKDEREDGECCPLIEDRVKIDLSQLNCVPDIESYYSENFRHINYWVTREEWPDIEGSIQYFSEAVEMLKDYKLGSKKPIVDKREPYNFAKFNDVVKDMNFTDLFTNVADERIGFGSMVMKLLEEDGWLCTDGEGKFWFHFNTRYNIDIRQTVFDERMIGEADQGLSYLEYIQKYGTAYYITACVLGDTWNSEIAGQNALAQLHRSESLSNLADLGARLSFHIQDLNSKATACPPPRYFKEAAEAIAKHTKSKTPSIDRVKVIFETYEKLSSGVIKMEIGTASALKHLSVPQMEDMRSPDVGLKWLDYVERRREELLVLVADSQFELTKSVSNTHIYAAVCLFPQYDILENRILEEMAAMQKCLELGGMYYAPAYGLCRLITHRFHWLQACYNTWKNNLHSFVAPNMPLSTLDVLEAVITIRIRMLATFIPLQALFLTYISQFKTTHPITEVTVHMLFEWADSARIWCSEDKRNIAGGCLGDYARALEIMGCDYMDQMLLDCKQVWVVANFISNPELNTLCGSLDHAQQILSTLTQMFLMSFYTILTRFPKQTSYMKLADSLTQQIIQQTVVLRQVELEDPFTFKNSWPKIRQNLKKGFQSIWSDLLEFRKFLCGADPCIILFPEWQGNNLPIWKEYFAIFIRSHYKTILHKMAFSDFMNTANPDSSEHITNSKKESKQNKKKESKTKSINDAPVEESKRKKKNNKNNASVEQVTYELSITQIKSKDNCLVVARETVVDREMFDAEERENLSKKDNTQVGKKGKPNNTDKMKGKTKIDKEENLQVKKKMTENNDVILSGADRHKNSDKSQVEEDEEQLENATANKLKTCTYCKNIEPLKRTYKKCALCKKEGWAQPRFYCSQTCQVKDWKERHNMEHKNGVQEEH